MLIITYTPMYSARRIVINFCVPQLLQLIKTILIGPIGNGARGTIFATLTLNAYSLHEMKVSPSITISVMILHKQRSHPSFLY
jgi:hypothetical protein